MTCDRCGATLQVGSWPFCPHGRPALAVIDDSVNPHWCETLDHDPVFITSKSQLRREAAARGLVNVVRHEDAYYVKQRAELTERYADERASSR